jgi:hypothetical protein
VAISWASNRNLTNHLVYQEQPNLGKDLRNGHLDYLEAAGLVESGKCRIAETAVAEQFSRDGD